MWGRDPPNMRITLGWARSADNVADVLRRGAWYPVVEDAADGHVVVEVRRQRIRLNRADVTVRTVTSARLSRIRCRRTSTTTCPSAASSTTGYHAPRRSTSATLSALRAQPSVMRIFGGSRPHMIPRFDKFGYARARSRGPAADPALVPQDGREAASRVRPRSDS